MNGRLRVEYLRVIGTYCCPTRLQIMFFEKKSLTKHHAILNHNVLGVLAFCSKSLKPSVSLSLARIGSIAFGVATTNIHTYHYVFGIARFRHVKNNAQDIWCTDSITDSGSVSVPATAPRLPIHTHTFLQPLESQFKCLVRKPL